MAVHSNNGTNNVNVNLGQEEATTTSNTTSGNNGFNGRRTMNNMFNGFMKSASNNDFIKKFREDISAILAEQDVFNVKIFTFDNTSNYKGWAYSFLVVAMTNNDTRNVFYMPLLLEATGREPVNVKQVIEIDPRTGVGRVKDPSMLFTPSDYFNDVVLTEIENQLKISYPDKTAKYVDGEVVPYSATPERVAPTLAIDAYDGCYLNFVKEGDFTDLNVQELVADRSYQAMADVTIASGAGVNRLDRATAIDFQVKLQMKKQGNQVLPTMVDQSRELGNITGYIEETIIAQPDAFGKVQKKAIATTIINEVDTEYPTLGYSLLNIASVSMFTNPSLFANALYNKQNIGALNYVLNLEAKNEFGAKLNLKDSKTDFNKAVAVLQKMFLPKPAAAIEVEQNGREYFKMSPWAALIDPSIAANANEFIVNVAEELVGQQFNNRQVFLYAIETPIGEFTDGNGNVRDIREIDLSTVMSLTNDVSIIQRWLMSNEDPKVTNIDPYVTKLEVYAKLGLEVRVHNKAVRVYLNPAFIDELTNKLSTAGITPVLTSDVPNYTSFFDQIASGTSSLANATLNAQFGAMPGMQGQGYRYQNYGYASGFFK